MKGSHSNDRNKRKVTIFDLKLRAFRVSWASGGEDGKMN